MPAPTPMNNSAGSRFRRSPRRLISRATSASAGTFEPLEQRQLLATVFAVTGSNTLLQFDSATPSAIVRSVPITGLGNGQSIATIDFRPGTGTLYGMASGTLTPLYTINPNTGAATRISGGLPGGFDTNYAVGMDFDDLTSNGSSAGILRYTDELGGSYRFDPNSGIYIRNDAGREGLTDVAYRRTGGNASVFQMVGVNYQTDELQVINPQNGQLISAGALGVDTDKWVGLDIYGQGAEGVIYAALRVGGSTRFGFIGGDGHTFTDLGPIGDGSATVRGLSFDPDPLAPSMPENASGVLSSINEDDSSSAGTLISSLIAPGGTGLITDPSPGAQLGVAITGADTAHGSWQYSLNGSNWQALGNVSADAALLLRADSAARVRFVPSANFNGTIAGALSFRAWDQTQGSVGDRVSTLENGGSTAFSSVIADASLTVSPVRDAPSISIPQPGSGIYSINDNQTVGPFATAVITYLDSANQLLTIDVLGDPDKGNLTDASIAAAGFMRTGPASGRFVGTAAQATSALRMLTYKPLENIAAIGDTTVSVFTVQVNDQLGSPVQTLSPFVAARSVRDVPTVEQNTPVGGFFAITDIGTVRPFQGVTISTVDLPAPSLTVDAILDPSQGSFTSESLASTGFVQVDSTTYRFTGDATQATSAARLLDFSPRADAAPSGITSTSFRLVVSDGVNTPIQIDSPEVRIEALNDGPTVAGFTVNNRIKINKTVKPFRNISVQDPDAGDSLTAVIVLNKPAKAKFTVASLTTSGFARAGRGRWTFSGSAAELTIALRQMVFQYNSIVARNQTHPVKLTLTVTDAAGASVENGQTGVQVRL